MDLDKRDRMQSLQPDGFIFSLTKTTLPDIYYLVDKSANIEYY